MRVFFVSLWLALGAAFPTSAAERNDELPQVIQRQINAFLADDFETAFTFASPNIRRLFGTPENFGVMVRRGYPMVWRPADVEYLDQEMQGRATLQRVLIRDAAGSAHLLEYQMIETPDGWQINGVRILEPPGVGA